MGLSGGVLALAEVWWGLVRRTRGCHAYLRTNRASPIGQHSGLRDPSRRCGGGRVIQVEWGQRAPPLEVRVQEQIDVGCAEPHDHSQQQAADERRHICRVGTTCWWGACEGSERGGRGERSSRRTGSCLCWKEASTRRAPVTIASPWGPRSRNWDTGTVALGRKPAQFFYSCSNLVVRLVVWFLAPRHRG